MSMSEPDMSTYNAAMITALRSTDPTHLRQFASIWGARLGNRGLKALAGASGEVVERRMWMMIYDRPDLSDLHDQAESWLAAHLEVASE